MTSPSRGRKAGPFVDLSHTVEDGMVTYPGLPPPTIEDHLSREASRALYAPGTEFHIGWLHMVGNTGTYIDSPFHRYSGGKDLAELPLSSLADLEALIVRVKGPSRAIDELGVPASEVRGRALLFHTGWDRHWRTPRYAVGHPFLTGRLAQELVDLGAALVGIDSYNIDSTDTGERPVHSTLLAHDTPVVEHLCGLQDVPDRGSRFFALPVKVRGLGSFPVRAFCILPG